MARRRGAAEPIARNGRVDLEVLPDLPGGKSLREHLHRGGSCLPRGTRMCVRRLKCDVAQVALRVRTERMPRLSSTTSPVVRRSASAARSAVSM